MKSIVRLQEEPMFCVETAIKMLYFSALAYRVKEPSPEVELSTLIPCYFWDQDAVLVGAGKKSRGTAAGGAI